MQNCGVRLLPLDFRDQYFGCEIELTGINRATAAQTLADLFGTRAEHSGGGYDAYRVKDLDGKEWKIVRDGSIHPESRRRSVLIGETYKVELNSPKLEYGEMKKLQEVVRSLRRAGGIVNDSCGMHVHVDASKHTPQSLKNVLSIMYSKEDILFAALKVNPARIDSYCQAVDEPILEEIRKLPSGASMDQLKDRWYQGRDGSDYHYHSSRYRACNMHSVFYHGTIEWRLFNSTLHAGEAKANIILAMAISAQGINQKYTQFRKTPIGDNPAFTFRTFLLRLGLIGPEYKNVRMTWEKFWSIIDRVRAKADMQDEASVKQFLYTELIKLPQDELLGFDCAWQSYRNKANFPKMVAAACIINDGSSDDRFTDFRNWLIMQGYDAYRQALIDPDNLAALNIPFRDTEWMGCGNVAWYAYAGQKLRTYFEKAGIAAELHRRYPTLLKLPDDLHRAIMQEQLAPHRAQETEWERQMLRTEVKHYIEVSDLAYSYNKFYAQNMPDKVAWETLQSDLFANLPQIKAERMPQDFSVVLPKLWRKRQAWDTERTKRPPYRGEER